VKAHVEDWCLRDRLVYVLCDYRPDGIPNNCFEKENVTVVMRFDFDRSLNVFLLLNYNGEEFDMSAELLQHIRRKILSDFDPEKVAADWLENNDGFIGRLYRHSSEPDWDTRAKDYRMDREERKDS
jgi:hypothetical protein